MNEGQNINGIYSAPRPDFQSVRPVGDIVLTPGVEKKKSKLPWIVAGVVLALMIIVLGVIIIGRLREESSLSLFADFYTTVKSGPDEIRKQFGEYIDEGDNDNDWFIFAIDRSPLTGGGIEQYKTELHEKYNKFKDRIMKEDNLSDDFKEDVESCDSELKAILQSEDAYRLAETLVSEYINHGSDVANKKIEESYPLLTNKNDKNYGRPVGRAMNGIHRYMQSWVDLAEQYKKIGCINDENLDEVCVESRANANDLAAIAKIRSEQSISAQIIQVELTNVKKNFIKSVKNIDSTLHGGGE